MLNMERPTKEQKASIGKTSSFTINSDSSNLDLKILGKFDYKDESLTKLLQIRETNEDSDDDVT